MTKDNCWELQYGLKTTPMLVTSLELFNQFTGKWYFLENIIVDSGFDGDLILDSKLYEELGFNAFELSSSNFDVAESINGTEIELRSTVSKIKWIKEIYEIRVDTFHNSKENIIGRGLLLKNSFSYNVDDELFCVK